MIGNIYSNENKIDEDADVNRDWVKAVDELRAIEFQKKHDKAYQRRKAVEPEEKALKFGFNASHSEAFQVDNKIGWE